MPDEDKETAQAVSIKAPAFSEASPTLWFKILESQFHLKGITTSQTKFFHAMSFLTVEVLLNVSDSVLNKENYDELKESISSFYEKTKPELFEKLIFSASMTGRPSVYLRELQQVATKLNVGEELVRHKFIQNLPATIAPVIAAQKSLDLHQLGNVADELMPLHTQLHNLNQVNNTSKPNDYQTNDDSSNNIGSLIK
jgi:hypothetical protein